MNAKLVADEKIARIVIRLQGIYVSLTVLLLAALSFEIISSGLSSDSIEGVLILLLYGSIYAGLRLRKSWVVPLIIISSVFLLIGGITGIVQPADELAGIFYKILSFLIAVLSVYQLSFFSRREVKVFFGFKGMTVF